MVFLGWGSTDHPCLTQRIVAAAFQHSEIMQSVHMQFDITLILVHTCWTQMLSEQLQRYPATPHTN